LEKEIMLAYEDGRRRRGRPRRKWMNAIHEVTGMKLVELRDGDDRKETLEKTSEDARAQRVDSTR